MFPLLAQQEGGSKGTRKGDPDPILGLPGGKSWVCPGSSRAWNPCADLLESGVQSRVGSRAGNLGKATHQPPSMQTQWSQGPGTHKWQSSGPPTLTTECYSPSCPCTLHTPPSPSLPCPDPPAGTVNVAALLSTLGWVWPGETPGKRLEGQGGGQGSGRSG